MSDDGLFILLLMSSLGLYTFHHSKFTKNESSFHCSSSVNYILQSGTVLIIVFTNITM